LLLPATFATNKTNDSASFDLSINKVTGVYDMDALILGLMPSPRRTVRATLTAKFWHDSRCQGRPTELPGPDQCSVSARVST
jgi:phosphoribosylformylglycinamidine (FGAM) synthase-like amidotransferase family enzyme